MPALGSTARKIPHHFGAKIPQIGAETRRRIKYNQVWYTAEGGITALDVMLQDLESELLSQ